MICLHCKQNPVNRPRGLCWTCYYADGVREMYPDANQRFIRLGTGHKGGHPLPRPTDAMPGTDEKIEEMARRVASGLAIHHPQDARPGDDPAW